MITVYGFGRVHEKVIGETRDLRVLWALEEMGLPYKVHGLDHSAGDLNSAAYNKISYFNQIPILNDDGFILSETGAIVLYLAEKSKKLMPIDFQGRMRVTQWCFVALSTVEHPLADIQMIDGFGIPNSESRRAEMVKWAQRCLSGIEKRLSETKWIAGDEFTVADVLLTCVLREVRFTELLKDYPLIQAYYKSALARPAWQKAVEVYADTLGVEKTWPSLQGTEPFTRKSGA